METPQLVKRCHIRSLIFSLDPTILRDVVANDKTIESVVNGGLCTGCGTCAGICSKCAVEMLIDHGLQVYVPRLDKARCDECGVCVDVCPAHAADFKQLNLDVFGREPEDVLVGNYRSCYFGYATDHDIRYNSASGGLVTALLVSALEQGLINGALVTRMREDKPLEPLSFIARTREEIISAAKSKYCPVPANIALEAILDAVEGERFAVVGLPCHIQGIRKAEAVNEKLRERIALHLGLFCIHTSTFGLTDFLIQKYGARKEDVSQFSFRGYGWPGQAVIQTGGGTRKSIPQAKWLPWHTLGFFIPSGCDLCPDGLAEFADISFGDAWLPGFSRDRVGRSVIVSRNETAEQVLADLVAKGRVNLEKAEARSVVQAHPGLLYRKKKSLAARRNLFHRDARLAGYYLKPDMLDYAWAVYHHYYSLPALRYSSFRRILARTPVELVRLGGAPMYAVSRIQMKRVVRSRYGASAGRVTP